MNGKESLKELTGSQLDLERLAKIFDIRDTDEYINIKKDLDRLEELETILDDLRIKYEKDRDELLNLQSNSLGKWLKLNEIMTKLLVIQEIKQLLEKE